VVPTDTVYGLAALPERDDAVQRIYEAKERPEGMHLPVLAASHEQVRNLGVELTAAATALAARWWPGPLTLAFGFSDAGTRPHWLSGRDEVAVRIPRNDFLAALLEDTGVLLVTSANRHGATTPPSAGAAAGDLASHVSLVVDAGTLSSTPSTLVNVRTEPPVVEREGSITTADIAATLAKATGPA
jgi:L-threonylcarbamoyladenylate synthase